MIELKLDGTIEVEELLGAILPLLGIMLVIGALLMTLVV